MSAIHSVDHITDMELSHPQGLHDLGLGGLGRFGAGATPVPISVAGAGAPNDSVSGMLTAQLTRSQVLGPLVGALGGFLVQRNLVGVLVGAQVGDYVIRKKIELDAPPPAPGTPVPNMLDTGETMLKGFRGMGAGADTGLNMDIMIGLGCLALLWYISPKLKR